MGGQAMSENIEPMSDEEWRELSLDIDAIAAEKWVIPTALLRRMKARLDALQAVVDKLPKTADGVPVVPGMTCWRLHDYVGPLDGHVVAIRNNSPRITLAGQGQTVSFPTREVFSTRALAEAALKEQRDKEATDADV